MSSLSSSNAHCLLDLLHQQVLQLTLQDHCAYEGKLEKSDIKVHIHSLGSLQHVDLHGKKTH